MTTYSLASERIDRNNPLPYYVQLRQLLLRHITDGQLAPGELLPSEAELCEMFDVSRTVVRQAVGELVNAGRLRRQQGCQVAVMVRLSDKLQAIIMRLV